MSSEFSHHFETAAQEGFLNAVTSCWIETIGNGNYLLDHIKSNDNRIMIFERGEVEKYKRFTVKVEIDPKSDSLTPESLLLTKICFSDTYPQYDIEQLLVSSEPRHYRHRDGKFSIDLLENPRKDSVYNSRMFWQPAGIIKLETLTRELFDTKPEPAFRY